ncbi:MAG: glutamate formimidoyltransferase [Syntrophaceae bacterium]|nr:glutamate formimidoyltransferase [Syntrophaceae bacterium]
MSNPLILECIPNFSEGRDRQTMESVAAALDAYQGVKRLDLCLDRDHHRSVLTFLGEPEAVVKGALAVCRRALERIDMRDHRGGHPRIGAVDVIPFVPLGGAGMDVAVEAARRFGAAFGEECGVPVFFYGEAALRPERRQLPQLRRGGYEGLRERMKNPAWWPDAGPVSFNERSGASAVGARMPLVAFNVNLDSGDVELARRIAGRIRESGGGLPALRAIGVFLESRGIAQVSMNLTDWRVTPVRAAFEAVEAAASSHGVGILESELIGLAPRGAFTGVSPEAIKLRNFSEKHFLESHLPGS